MSAFPAEGAPTANLLHRVLVARASGDEATARVLGDLDELATDAVVATVAVPVAAEVRARLDEALPDERHDVLVDVVRHAIARVLRVADPASLQRDQPLLDLGFDSLMAVELRNVLRQSLALEQKLPATLVFDHPTVAAIATYLERLLGGPGEPDAPAPVDRAEPRPTLEAAAVAELSEDEVEAMLLSRLAEMEP